MRYTLLAPPPLMRLAPPALGLLLLLAWSPVRAETPAAGDDDGSFRVDDDGDSFRIDDDLDDVGAVIEIDPDDLTTTTTGTTASSGGASVTQLETLAMAYARSGIDLVHDPVPLAADGLPVVGEEILSFRLHGRAEGTARFGRRTKVNVAGRFDAEMSLDSDANTVIERQEAQVWDTYVDLYGDWIDLRFGNQIIAWGTADLLSPNDVVNPRDLRRGPLERPEELRIPVLALSSRIFRGPLSLQTIWLPSAPINRFELLDGDYALLGRNAATGYERRVGAIISALAADPMFGPALSPLAAIGAPPRGGISTSELGANLGLQLRKLDLHGYGFWGHPRNPRLRINQRLREVFATHTPDELTPELLAGTLQQLAADGEAAVVVEYPRQIRVGAAMATRLEPIGIKLDGAYTFGADAWLVPSPAAGPLLATSTLLDQFAITASLDYDRGTELAIVVEGSYLKVLGVPDGGRVYQMDGDQLFLAAARVQWTPARSPASLRFLGIVDLSSPSYALRPAVRLSGHDNLSIEASLTLFGGPDPAEQVSFGGVFSRNDQLALTVQYGL